MVALVTTWFNNRGQNKRHAEQLRHDIDQRTRQLQHDADQRKVQFEHDADQHRTDREMGLRRDVYLEATAATGKLQEFIASYARQDISENDKIVMTQGATAALNKVHIIGTNRTIEALTATQRTFAKCSLRLAEIKLDIVRKKIDIEQVQRHLRLLADKREGIIQVARNLGPTPDPGAVSELRLRFESLDGEVAVISGALDKTQDELFALQMALVKKSAESNLEMTSAFSEAVLAIREKMRLGLDVDAYRAFMKDQQDQAGKEFDAFLANISGKAEAE
jgi:hypothetical protein